MTDLILASAHHLLVFLIVATLATELTLCRPGIDDRTLTMLGRIDLGYGLLFGLLLAVGSARVLMNDKGADFYLHNPVFWAKMATLGVVAVLSLPPTLTILRWNRQRRADGGAPTGQEIHRVRNWMHGEAGMLLAVPVLAAAMARGYGL